MIRAGLSVVLVLLVFSSVEAQEELPAGASMFFKQLGGLGFSRGKVGLLEQIAADKIDKVEAGGGVVDWTRIDGRVFARTTWMIEIGEMTSNYGSYELEESLAAEMQRKLKSEGFRVTPTKFDLHYLRYQKGTTVGTVEVRSFFLSSGNLPLRFEFIFNESYRPNKKSRKHGGRSR